MYMYYVNRLGRFIPIVLFSANENRIISSSQVSAYSSKAAIHLYIYLQMFDFMTVTKLHSKSLTSLPMPFVKVCFTQI